MANIKLTLDYPLEDGQSLTFKAPCDCTAATGLIIYYPIITETESTQTSQTFVFKDAHGNNLADIRNLFTAGAYLKAIVNTTDSVAYLQNADTNGYLEQAIANAKVVADGSVTTEKLANGAVTNEKMDLSAGFSPTGYITLVQGKHYFNSEADLPKPGNTGRLYLVKVT